MKKVFDELIKALRHCAECDHHGCAADCRFGKEHPLNFICIEYLQREAADAIEELRAKADLHKEVAEEYRRVNMMLIDKFPQWIPVSERLPENGEYVLCFCRANIVCVLRRDKDGDWYENPTHVYMSGFVTHWMPLPEPPEKESES